MTQDTCKICGAAILWLAGAQAWMHETGKHGGHWPEPTRRTDLKPYLGSKLHQIHPCDKCASVAQEQPTLNEWGNHIEVAAMDRTTEDSRGQPMTPADTLDRLLTHVRADNITTAELVDMFGGTPANAEGWTLLCELLAVAVTRLARFADDDTATGAIHAVSSGFQPENCTDIAR